MLLRNLKAGDRLIIGAVIIEVKSAGASTLRVAIEAPLDLGITHEKGGCGHPSPLPDVMNT